MRPTRDRRRLAEHFGQIAEAFKLVGNNVRDRSDMSYQRPSTLSPERIVATKAQK